MTDKTAKKNKTMQFSTDIMGCDVGERRVYQVRDNDPMYEVKKTLSQKTEQNILVQFPLDDLGFQPIRSSIDSTLPECFQSNYYGNIMNFSSVIQLHTLTKILILGSVAGRAGTSQSPLYQCDGLPRFILNSGPGIRLYYFISHSDEERISTQYSA